MTILNIETDQDCVYYIKRRLKFRDMAPVFFEDWEVHGPHPGVDSQVFVGPAKCHHLAESFVYVAIYPGAVYEIDDRDKWSNPKKEDSILMGK
jgi:hypothetical protein